VWDNVTEACHPYGEIAESGTECICEKDYVLIDTAIGPDCALPCENEGVFNKAENKCVCPRFTSGNLCQYKIVLGSSVNENLVIGLVVGAVALVFLVGILIWAKATGAFAGFMRVPDS
jgi:hypothetical protein